MLCSSTSRRPPHFGAAWRSTTCGCTNGVPRQRQELHCGARLTRCDRTQIKRSRSPPRGARACRLITSQNPTGRVVITASGANAEGATTPESLRPTDRLGEATLESSRSNTSGSPTGKTLTRRVKLSGIDDSGGANSAAPSEVHCVTPTDRSARN